MAISRHWALPCHSFRNQLIVKGEIAFGDGPQGRP